MPQTHCDPGDENDARQVDRDDLAKRIETCAGARKAIAVLLPEAEVRQLIHHPDQQIANLAWRELSMRASA